MLEIRSGNDKLDLGNYSVNFELKSPLFNDEGSFSFPFTLPPTAKNKRLLGYPARINNNLDTEPGTWDIYLKGLFWKKAGLEVRESNRDYIKVYFKMDEGDIYDALRNTKLNEIDLGGERNKIDYAGIGLNMMWSPVYNNFYPDVDFALFPLNAPEFTENYDLPIPPYPVDHKLEYFNEPNFWDNTWYMARPENVIMPFVYAKYLIDKSFDYFNIICQSNFLENAPELQQLVIFHNKIYSELNSLTGIVSPDQFNLNNHVPNMSIGTFFNQFTNVFATTLFYNSNLNEISLKSFNEIINENDVIDFSSLQYRIVKLYKNDFKGYKLDFDTSNIDLDNIDPEVLKEFNFRGSVVSFADLPNASQSNKYHYYFVEDENAYFISFNGWVNMVKGPYLNFISGQGKHSIDLPSGLLGNKTNRNAFIHVDALPGAFDQITEDEKLSLLFYRGYIYEENGFKPVGSPYAKNKNWPDVSFDYSLTWHGPTGLYHKFWKSKIDFLKATKQAEFKMLLDPSNLKQIDFSKKYRFASANWLLDTVKIQVSNDKISPAEITAWKV